MVTRRYRFIVTLVSLFSIISMLVLSFPAAPTQAAARPADPADPEPFESGVLVRATITLPHPADQFHLDRLGVAVLNQEDARLVVLVDEQQLAALARLGFQPQDAEELSLLANAHQSEQQWLVSSLQPVLTLAATAETQLAQEEDATETFSQLQVAIQALSAAQRVGLANLNTLDDDGDGLTNTEERWWCTDPDDPATRGNPEYTDYDYVSRIKQYMWQPAQGDRRIGQPFQGWPPETTNFNDPSRTFVCPDTDGDSVPDGVERVLGLSENRPSTDRDRYSDGLELFGLDKDGETMPAIVLAPGNHPAVAAYPKIQVDMIPGSINVETVTELYLEQSVITGTATTYGTSETRGVSDSVANTETWNSWQEVSVTTPIGLLSQYQRSNSASLQADATCPGVPFDGICTCPEFAIDTECWSTPEPDDGPQFEDYDTDQSYLGCPGILGPLLGKKKIKRLNLIDCLFFFKDYNEYLEDRHEYELETGVRPVHVDADNQLASFNNVHDVCSDTSVIGPVTLAQQLTCFQPADRDGSNQRYAGNPFARESSQGRTGGALGSRYSFAPETGQWSAQSSYPVSYPAPPRQLPTRTTTQGSSVGGARTVTHTEYQEHTVTQSEQFSREEGWLEGSSRNTAHVADLTFSYRIENVGTDYARSLDNLIFNIYLGSDPNPAITCQMNNPPPDRNCNLVALDNVFPGDQHTFTSGRIHLSFEQLKAIDLGGPIYVVVEDYSLGEDDVFLRDAQDGGVTVVMDDGVADGDESNEVYLLPTWEGDRLIDVLGRYFPVQRDAEGDLISIATPEFDGFSPRLAATDTDATLATDPTWIERPLADNAWFNVFLGGMGDSNGNLREVEAQPGSVTIVRYQVDTDYDGYSDRSEKRLRTDPEDPTDHPEPGLIAAINTRADGDEQRSYTTLLNTGNYDAYGVELVMYAPDPTIDVLDNTIGGGGRVPAASQVVLGSTISGPNMSGWSNSSARPYATGSYSGNSDRIYTFTAQDTGAVGGAQPIRFTWSDGTSSGEFELPAGYQAPLPLEDEIAHGIQVGFYSGSIVAGDSFEVAAALPLDTFRFTRDAGSTTEPGIIVSYSDPQGSHRFISPVTVNNLQSDLLPYQDEMLEPLSLEIETTAPFNPDGDNTTNYIFNLPDPRPIVDAQLFVNYLKADGTLVAEQVFTQTLQPGPNIIPVTWDTSMFTEPYDPESGYNILAIITDWQGNIIQTLARPLFSFQADPVATLTLPAGGTTWDFGTATRGEMLEHTFAFANTGEAAMYSYLASDPSLQVSGVNSRVIAPGDMATYDVMLDTASLEPGSYSEAVTIRSSDADTPVATLNVQGTIISDTVPIVRPVPDRPLDVNVTIPGNRSAGEWAIFTHTLQADPQSLHPVFVYSPTSTLPIGPGRYAADFDDGTSSAGGGAVEFGDGRDGDLVVAAGDTTTINEIRSSVNAAGETATLADATGFAVGDIVLLHQTQGSSAGDYELAEITTIDASNTITFTEPLSYTYITSGGDKAQIIQVPQYQNVTVERDGVTFLGEYFSSDDFSEAPVFVRNDPIIDFDWAKGSPGPGLPSDLFAVRWTGQIYFPETREYTFRANTDVSGDERIRMYVDGNLIYEYWPGGNRNTFVATTSVDEGMHEVQLVFQDAANGARISFGIDDLTPTKGILTAQEWDGNTGGILAFLANGRVVVDGLISMSEKGFRGAAPADSQGRTGSQGEGYTRGPGSSSINNNTSGGGGGEGATSHVGRGGGGGGHANNGVRGRSGSGRQGGEGGDPVGTDDLSTLFFGGGGGSGGSGYNYRYTSGAGGNGGGVIMLAGSRVSVSDTGTIRANGGHGTNQASDTNGGGGGGAGGSILLQTSQADWYDGAVVTAKGIGAPGIGAWFIHGGAGSDGRIRLEYCNNLTGTTNPPASTAEIDCYMVEQIEEAPYTSARLNLPADQTNASAYRVQYGRRVVFTDTTTMQTTTLPIPAGAVARATLDALLSDVLSDTVTLRIDVGATNTWDWETSGDINATAHYDNIDLTEAFNAYWQAQGAPTTGTLDVPIRIEMTTPGQLLLTDLHLVTSGLDATLIADDIAFAESDPVETDTVTVTATLNNPGGSDSGPLTVSFFSDSQGLGTTYIGSTLLNNIPAGGSAEATIPWNTLGFTGTVPVRVVADPFNRLPEIDEENNVATADITISTRPDMQLGTLRLSDDEPVVGQTITATLHISNTGHTLASSQQIALYQGNPDDGVLIETRTLASLAGEGAATVRFTWVPTTTGEARLYIRLDADGDVNESDETNNDSWHDLYVGFAGPLLVDSGDPADDLAYSGERGYGAVDEASEDALENCGPNPDQTYRRDPSGMVVYRFDHLQPGHFYHLDLTMFECESNAGRLQSVLVDGTPLAGPYDLGDGTVQRVSLLLDPALYADRSIEVMVESRQGLGAIVNQIALHDIDYRYADAGGDNDPRYPGERHYGWLNGDRTTDWGTLPYQSARVDQTGDTVQYRFDHLQPLTRYRISATFFQSNGPNRVQQMTIDGEAFGTQVILTTERQETISGQVPLGTYADDGSIVVSITRSNGNGAVVNEIALEEETQVPVQTQLCPIPQTPTWTAAYGAVLIDDELAPPGTLVTAETPRGDLVGCFEVTEEGLYGFMPIYGADPEANPPVPGMQDGETVIFRVNGALAVADPLLTWRDDKTPQEINLNVGAVDGQPILLRPGWNLISTRVEPPLPLIETVFRSIEGRYCRVLASYGLYDCALEPEYHTLTELHAAEAYYVYLDSAASAVALIEGVPIDADTPLALNTGLNWTGYLPTASLPVTEALQSIAGKYIHVADGSGRIYSPGMATFNTLTTMNPGRGYFIYASEPLSLTYPATIEPVGLAITSPADAPATAVCTAATPTPFFSAVYGTLTINGAPAPAGTRISAYTPAGTLAGCTTTTETGSYGFLTLFGADGERVTGYHNGDAIELRVNGASVGTLAGVRWQDDKAMHQIDLNVTYRIYLPRVHR